MRRCCAESNAGYCAESNAGGGYGNDMGNDACAQSCPHIQYCFRKEEGVEGMGARRYIFVLVCVRAGRCARREERQALDARFVI